MIPIKFILRKFKRDASASLFISLVGRSTYYTTYYSPAYYKYTAPQQYKYYYIGCDSEDIDVLTSLTTYAYYINYYSFYLYFTTNYPTRIIIAETYGYNVDWRTYTQFTSINGKSYYQNIQLGLGQAQKKYAGEPWTNGADMDILIEHFIGLQNGYYYYQQYITTMSGTIIEDSWPQGDIDEYCFHISLSMTGLASTMYTYTNEWYYDDWWYRYTAATYAYTAAYYKNTLKYRYYTV